MQRITEPFSTYGTGSGGRTNMLRNPLWLDVPSNCAPSTSNPRGSLGTHSLRVTTSGFGGPRAAFSDTEITEFILAAAFSLDALPGDNQDQILFQPRGDDNSVHCTVTVGATGKLYVYTGSSSIGPLVAETDDPAISADTYHHVEVYFNIANSGTVEIRVDEVIVLNVSAIDTKGSAAGASQALVFASFTASGTDWDITDFGARDLTGADNNDFGGDIVYYTVDMASTDSSDWTRNTGASDQAAVDDVTPDDDTTYIATSVPGDQVRFRPTTVLPANISEITSATIRTLPRKADSGAASNMASLVSVANSPADVDDGEDVPIALTYGYTDDIFAVDPSTGVAITPASYPDLRVQYEKTT